jgi:hypothetical protein
VKQKVDGHQGLYKDSKSGVIVNRSDVERNRYRIAKQQALMNLNSQEEVINLRQEVNELKDLIKQLLDK